MAEKKVATKKPVGAARKPAAKKPVAKKPVAKKPVARGQSLVCGVCGLAVSVDEACGCVGVHELICCGKPMKARKAKAKAAK